MDPSTKRFWQTFLAFAMLFSALAIYQTQQQTQALVKISTRYKWVIVIGILALNVLAGAYLLYRNRSDTFWSRLDFRPRSSAWAGLAGCILILIPFPILWYAKADFWGRGPEAFFRLMWTLWWLILLQVAGFKLVGHLSLAVCFAFALLLDGIAFQTYVAFRPLTDYPFSVGWSEASRFYYGSLVFSKSVYGVSLPLSIWHGTRYLLLSIPFLFNGLPLWADRLWQIILWLGITGLTSWLFVRRIRPPDRITGVIFGSWFFLYLFQGAVYYHLQICVIIVLLGVSPRHPWRSLMAVAASSFWAGMSRLNWYPVPALLAATLYLLEVPFSGKPRFWRYLAKPAGWGVLGLAAALLGQAFYVSISGNTDLRAFGSSLTSPLLWYRWFPNETNHLGIVPGIFLVSMPLILALFQALKGRLANLHSIRWSALLAMLLVLLAGGLVVSTKIGGGGDLHNMDAYMVMLALITAYFATRRAEAETAGPPAFGPLTWPIILLMLVIPVGFSLSRVAPPFVYDKVQAASDLSTLQETVQSYGKSGQVLFIYERHLLTFGEIQNIPIVPDYEVIVLTEMAISGNRPYLDRFYHDLESHRFAAIIAHRQNLAVNSGDFAEESEIWNTFVGQPLLCQYKPVVTLSPASNIQVFVPRRSPCTSFPPDSERP
jgi:hypothetical protein